jgi:hypothetical protein
MSEVYALEKQLADSRALIEKRELALRLYNNSDFKELIIDGFCTKDCARYAQSSADPALGANERADALGLAQAAGHLRRYLSVIVSMGNQAESQIPNIEQSILEARQEEGQ